MDNNENLLRPILLLWKQKKLILGLSLLLSIIAAGLSLLKPNYYESKSIFYPASTDLSKPLPIGTQSVDIDYYGTGDDLERLLAIASSSELKDYLIETFDLYKHYDINPSVEMAKYMMSLKLVKHFKTKRTKLDAIRLSFEDQDPEFAKDMVNAATAKLNEIAQKIIKQGQNTLIQSYTLAVSNKTTELNILSDKIGKLRAKHGIYNLESQSQTYSEILPEIESKLSIASGKYKLMQKFNAHPDTLATYQSIVGSYTSQVNNLKSKITLFNEGYLPTLNAEAEQEDFMKQYVLDKQRLSQLQSAYNSPFSAIHLIEAGEIPFIKSRPKRSFIVIGVAITSTLFLSMLVLIQDFVKSLIALNKE